MTSTFSPVRYVDQYSQQIANNFLVAGVHTKKKSRQKCNDRLVLAFIDCPLGGMHRRCRRFADYLDGATHGSPHRHPLTCARRGDPDDGLATIHGESTPFGCGWMNGYRSMSRKPW